MEFKLIVFVNVLLFSISLNGSSRFDEQVKSNCVKDSNNQQLLSSCRVGDRETALSLLKSKVDPCYQSKCGNFPLRYAVIKGDLVLVKELMSRKANINQTDITGKTALMIATERKNKEDLAEYLATQVSVDLDSLSQSRVDRSALMIASLLGKLGLIQIMIAKKANVNLKNSQKRTALNFAASSGKSKAVEILLESKACVKSQNNKGESALMVSVPNVDVMEILLSKKANPNLQDRIGDTPF